MHRVRYYHSQMDMEMLGKGAAYAQLPPAYVIFLCDFDPFGHQKYRYTFENRCLETGSPMDDECKTIFLNTHGNNPEEVSERLVNFLQFLNEDLKSAPINYEDSLIQSIQEQMEHVKTDRRLEVNYMLLQELIEQERKDAKTEGRTEGRKEGRKEDILELLSAYGPVPEDVKRLILDEQDFNTLKSYLKAAATANSIDEFVNTIK